MKNCIVLTGGGTAGHIMPIIALLPLLRDEFRCIIYIGSKNGMERDLIREYDFVKYYAIDTVKFDRVKVWKNLAIPFVLFKSFFQCKKIFSKCKPSCIFSKGGYVALPVVLSSGKIPVIAHESDISLGLANKLIYAKCKVMCTNFEQTALSLKKGVHTGIPIRNFEKSECKNFYKLYPHMPTLLIMGGSLGSKIINETLYSVLNKMCEKVNIIHIVGNGNKILRNFPENYNQYEYVNDMGYIFSIIDGAVCRAGANTMAELLNLNIPMLLIPLSKEVSRGDQVENANYFTQKGYSHMILSENLTPQNLYNGVFDLLAQKEQIKQNQKYKKVDSKKLIMYQIDKYALK